MFLKVLLKMAILSRRHEYQRGDPYFDTMWTETDEYESSVIVPNRTTITMIYRDGFIPLRHCLAGLNDNVSFLYTVLPANMELFRVSCDWCSLCNGMIHTAVENLRRHPHLSDTITPEILRFSRFLDRALARRQHRVSSSEIMTWCRHTFGRYTPSLVVVSKIYLQLEQVELRWCPFKRTKAAYYRNGDKRYVTPTLQNIQKIGAVLARNETVSCEQCPRAVNAALPTRPEMSLFEPLLSYMVEQL
jgi:hypothetical protein